MLVSALRPGQAFITKTRRYAWFIVSVVRLGEYHAMGNSVRFTYMLVGPMHDPIVSSKISIHTSELHSHSEFLRLTETDEFTC